MFIQFCYLCPLDFDVKLNFLSLERSLVPRVLSYSGTRLIEGSGGRSSTIDDLALRIHISLKKKKCSAMAYKLVIMLVLNREERKSYGGARLHDHLRAVKIWP